MTIVVSYSEKAITVTETTPPTEKLTEIPTEQIMDKTEEIANALPQPSEIEVVEYTDYVEAGSIAFGEIKGEPLTEYRISVYYSSTASKAQGLEKKYSDDNGYVKWEWKVGSNTNPGEIPIKIEGGGSQIKFFFVVYQ